MSMYSLLDSEYGLSNYSTCKGALLINPIHVDRDFDATTNTYTLLLQGDVPGITYPPVERYAIETTTFEIGFWPVTHEEHFRCQNCVQHGPIYFEKNFYVPRISFPLVDIACHYQIMMDTTPIICVNVAPIGYQNTTIWRKVFIYVPIGITALAAAVSLLCNIQTALRDDLFLALSNYALDWSTLRFKGSTAADIIFYAQYVFATGALNLRYPKFYAHFTSDFAWSWLLYAPPWTIRLLEHALKSSSKRTSANDQTSAVSKTSIAVSTNMTELAVLLNIDLRGMFLTSLLFICFLVVGLALVCLIFWLIWEVLALKDPYRFGGQRSKLSSTCIGFQIRLLTIFYTPLTALSFYQLMFPEPWYLTVLAALFFAIAMFGLYIYISIRIIKARPQQKLYNDLHMLLRFGCLYSTLQPGVFYFFIVVLVYKALVGGMVGLFQMNGSTQVAVMLVLECGMFAFHCVYAPYADKITQFVATLVACIRTIISALNLTYVDSFHAITDRQRQFIAYTQICMHFLIFSIFLGIHLSRLMMLLAGSRHYCIRSRQDNSRRLRSNEQEYSSSSFR